MEEPIKSVIVIGGGLGGLVFAQALKKSTDIKVSIFERDTAAYSRNQGYQIGLNPDGIKALRSILLPDLDKLIYYNDCNKFAITDNNLRVLMSVGGKKAGSEPSMALMNRWVLRDKLAEGLDIRWNKRLVSYEEKPNKVIAYFEDGTTEEADLLVGADGSRSTVRKFRCPSLTYDDIGIVQGAGHCPLPPQSAIPTMFPLLRDSAMRILAKSGKSCLVIKFKGDDLKEHLAWATSQPVKFGTLPEDSSQFKEYMLSHAEQYNRDFLEVVKSTPLENILPPKNMHSINTNCKDPFGKTTRVTLLGDAAHAMTTHAGLGGNTALQDAVDLAAALTEPNWHSALSKYETKMIARGFKNANTSMNSTNSLAWFGWKATFRNYLLIVMGYVIWALQKFF